VTLSTTNHVKEYSELSYLKGPLSLKFLFWIRSSQELEFLEKFRQPNEGLLKGQFKKWLSSNGKSWKTVLNT
jgi:hypothetical protein